MITIRALGMRQIRTPSPIPRSPITLMVSTSLPLCTATDFWIWSASRYCGPAGNAFGQNSTGGGINVITKAPTFDEFYGTADLTLGEYSLVKARQLSISP